MVRDFYGFTASTFWLTHDPACYFDPARIDQIARRLLVLAAVTPSEPDEAEWQAGEGIAPPGPALKTRLEAALAQCESQIAELQQAQTQSAQNADHGALLERLNSLESRVIEQERTIRHTMTILIEWIERDEAQVLAA